MLRTRKPIVLAIVTLVVAGCASSDRAPGSAQYPKFRSAKKSRSHKVREQQPPKILPQTHFAAGTLFEAQGRADKAIDQYRKSIAVNHNYVAAYHRLGRLLSKVGRHTEAADVLSHAVELSPDNAVIRNNYGYELMFERRWDEAERELRRAIALKPEMARAHINLGLVLSRAGRFDEALASFLVVLPEEDAHYNLGLMFRGQGRDEQAAEAFRHVLSVNEDFPAAETQLAQIIERLEPATVPEPTPVAKPLGTTRITKARRTAVPVRSNPDDPITRDDILDDVDEKVATAKVPTRDGATADIVPTPDSEPTVTTDATARTQTAATSDPDALAEFLARVGMVEKPGSDRVVEPDEPTPVADAIGKPETLAVARKDIVRTGTIAGPTPIPPEDRPLIEWDGSMVDLTTLVDILDNETRCFEQMEVAEPPEAVTRIPTTRRAARTINEERPTTKIALRTDDEPDTKTDTPQPGDLVGPPYESGVAIHVAPMDSDIIETGAADRVERLTERVRSFDTAGALDELEAKLSIVRNEIECLEEEQSPETERARTREATVSRTVRPTMAATVVTRTGPPANLAPSPEDLPLRNFARIQRRVLRSTTADNWRAAFNELDDLLSITQNEVACLRDLEWQAEESLATTMHRNSRPGRTGETETSPPPVSRTFGISAPERRPPTPK